MRLAHPRPFAASGSSRPIFQTLPPRKEYEWVLDGQHLPAPEVPGPAAAAAMETTTKIELFRRASRGRGRRTVRQATRRRAQGGCLAPAAGVLLAQLRAD